MGVTFWCPHTRSVGLTAHETAVPEWHSGNWRLHPSDCSLLQQQWTQFHWLTCHQTHSGWVCVGCLSRSASGSCDFTPRLCVWCNFPISTEKCHYDTHNSWSSVPFSCSGHCSTDVFRRLAAVSLVPLEFRWRCSALTEPNWNTPASEISVFSVNVFSVTALACVIGHFLGLIHASLHHRVLGPDSSVKFTLHIKKNTIYFFFLQRVLGLASEWLCNTSNNSHISLIKGITGSQECKPGTRDYLHEEPSTQRDKLLNLA